MLRRVVGAHVMRQSGRAAAAATGATALTCARAGYNWFVFKNPSRRPQLSPEERAEVKINYDEWPAEFRDYDPEDPYKRSPPVIDGLTSWNLFLWGIEFAFVYNFYELVFYRSI